MLEASAIAWNEGTYMILSQWTWWQLPIFFLLAFAITWSAQIPAYTRQAGHRLTVLNACQPA
jgi:hypothetical protein